MVIRYELDSIQIDGDTLWTRLHTN